MEKQKDVMEKQEEVMEKQEEVGEGRRKWVRGGGSGEWQEDGREEEI